MPLHIPVIATSSNPTLWEVELELWLEEPSTVVGSFRPFWYNLYRISFGIALCVRLCQHIFVFQYRKDGNLSISPRVFPLRCYESQTCCHSRSELLPYYTLDVFLFSYLHISKMLLDVYFSIIVVFCNRILCPFSAEVFVVSTGGHCSNFHWKRLPRPLRGFLKQLGAERCFYRAVR